MLKDPILQSRLESDGYVHIKVLGDKEIRAALDIYESVSSGRPKDQRGCHVSLLDNDKARVRAVHYNLVELLKPALSPWLKQEPKYITSCFLSKNAQDTDSAVYPHKDWSMVDERTGSSYNLWVPLVDTNAENGELGIIAGTHRQFVHHRGSPPQKFPRPLEIHRELLFSKMQFLPMKAGEGILYNHALIHGSYPNRSEAPRPVLATALVPEDTRLIHYFLLPGQNLSETSRTFRMHRYEVPSEFYFEVNPFEIWQLYQSGKTLEGNPFCKYLDEFVYEAPHFSTKDIEKVLSAPLVQHSVAA